MLFDESFNGPFGGGAGVLMNGKRNFMMELHRNVLIENKSELPEEMKLLFFKPLMCGIKNRDEPIKSAMKWGKIRHIIALFSYIAFFTSVLQ